MGLLDHGHVVGSVADGRRDRPTRERLDQTYHLVVVVVVVLFFFNQENGQLKKDHKGHYDAELGTSDFCSGDMRQQTTATQRLATWASKGARSRKASASEAPSTTRPTLAPGLAASFSLPGERNSR